MKFVRLSIPDVLVIEPRVFSDSRGFFFESYQREIFVRSGIKENFIQDNHNRSNKGVLRGLHYQLPPKTQAKLLRVIRGAIFDVMVDVREKSPTFGKHVSYVLSAENKHTLYVPKGFAHGFLVMEDGTECLYKVSDFYAPELERGIIWNDPALAIEWPKLDIDYALSDKDKKNSLLRYATLL